VLTVTAELEHRGLLEQAGGKAAIDALTGGVPGLGGVRRYAQIVIERYVDRERLSAAVEQQTGVLTHDDEMWERGVQRAHTVVANGVADGFLGRDRLAEHMRSWLQEPEDVGLPFPAVLPRVARMVRLRAGHTLVLGAWPSGGKTMTALAMAAAAGSAGHRTVVWTNEDTAEELVAKHVQSVTGIPASVIGDRCTTDERMPKVLEAIDRVPFEVQPCHDWTAAQIAAHVRRERPAVAVVDHFHNLQGIGTVPDTDESIRVLAAAAAQVGCLLVLCAQLNRNRMNGVCKPPPVAADLRGSGMFLSACHTMLLVHRDEEEAEDPVRGKLGQAVALDTGSVNVAKNKVTGRTGVVRVLFDAERLRYVEDGSAEPDVPEEVQEEWPF
jgi:replicative DNA helicase